MPVRKFISIDAEKCNGCGNCIIACAEGALAIVDGKAKVVSENLCDGFGACIGHCPMGALIITDEDVADFDEHAVEKHLRGHDAPGASPCCPSASLDGQNGCPSAKANNDPSAKSRPLIVASMLTHWPIQLALVNPAAAHFRNKKLLLAADCSAFSYGSFHQDFLAGAAIVIACPKLDNTHSLYSEKLAQLLQNAGTTMLEVVRMEVPCCGGLLNVAREAVRKAGTNCAVKETVIGLRGELLQTP